MQLKLPKNRTIYFAGIGGIGMSGLAKILISRGYKVAGSDAVDSDIIQKLVSSGAKVNIGQIAENIRDDIELYVYSAAIKKDNPEFAEVIKKDIKHISRSELLGAMMAENKGIAISGTHGKTTTSTMLSLIFEEAGLDPAISIGGEVKNIGGNAKDGEGEYFIAEACEYEKAFLDIHPFAAIITNIEADHLDTYSGLPEILETFKKFTTQISKDGFLVVSADCSNALGVGRKYPGHLITFGVNGSEADYKAMNVRVENGKTHFDATYKNEEIGSFSLIIPGEHNILNALSVIALSHTLNIGTRIIQKVLAEFTGAGRRYEVKGEKNGVLVIDDYGHHPTEVQATLAGVKSYYPKRKVWCVFQPHQYSRTRLLLGDFSKSFSNADHAIIPEIYEARDTEEDKKSVSSEILVEKINEHSSNAIYISTFEGCAEYLTKNAKESDIVITMGAGPVFKVGELFLST